MPNQHQNESRRGPSFNRRNLLRGAVVAGGLAAVGAGGVGVAQAQSFNHPGQLLQADEFDRMESAVQANREPWISGWNRLTANSHSSSTWQPRAVERIIRGDNGTDPENYWLLYNDMHAAYQNGLRWKISGDTAHRDAAIRILNAWSGTLKEIGGWTEASLAAGIYGYQAANAAEIVRNEAGFDRARFQSMLANVFYPLNNDFLVRRHGTCDSHYWANWDLCNMAAILAIGIFNEDQAKFDEAIEYFWNGKGNGSIEHVIPFIHGDLAQWQESGRDQAHSIMGIGLMAEFMEMAWNQGVDLYSARDHAFAKAAEYVARYNNGHSVPFTKYVWYNGHNCAYNEHTVISDWPRGQIRPVWELVYAHYYNRLGMAMPNVREMIGKTRPEGGGGDYGPNSGGFDSLGWGTLAYVRERTPTALNRLQSYNFQDRYVRHAYYDVRLDASISPAADAQFRLVPGLADSAGVSFEAANVPGYYLRHYSYDFRLDPNNGSSVFKADATFHRVAGLADGSWTSFRSHSHPDRYIRHSDYLLKLDQISDATGRADATYRITS
ncbi:AbfB domain-containing protein [Glycomyces buryatensis]|uniref:Cell wall anchor protein n=1 Tax=Glycomyces buryatensis TaxID=2570927 RepID=A0A4S8QDC9_9ACTN|nr:AbfB domain-containing protein [Glycomyces buryatensis]THV41082.1 cell wall anchor protein [Glycomyces buryatensis]